MTPKAVFLFCAPLALGAAAVGGLVELNDPTRSPDLVWGMIARLGEVMLLAALGMFAARGSGLKGSVITTSEEWRAALQEIVSYGVLPGFVLGLVNYLFFFYDRYSPYVEERIRNVETIYDTFVISLDAGLFEEVIYRLFVMSGLLFVFRHLYRGLRQTQPKLVAVLPRTMAVVISSLLFAIAHSVTGFTAAFTGGLLLGLIYLHSGIESAIAAHVGANFLFFSASYLS